VLLTLNEPQYSVLIAAVSSVCQMFMPVERFSSPVDNVWNKLNQLTRSDIPDGLLYGLVRSSRALLAGCSAGVVARYVHGESRIHNTTES